MTKILTARLLEEGSNFPKIRYISVKTNKTSNIANKTSHSENVFKILKQVKHLIKAYIFFCFCLGCL